MTTLEEYFDGGKKIKVPSPGDTIESTTVELHADWQNYLVCGPWVFTGFPWYFLVNTTNGKIVKSSTILEELAHPEDKRFDWPCENEERLLPVGSRVLVDGDSLILAQVGVGQVVFISLDDGNRWSGALEASRVMLASPLGITREEAEDLLDRSLDTVFVDFVKQV